MKPNKCKAYADFRNGTATPEQRTEVMRNHKIVTRVVLVVAAVIILATVGRAFIFGW